MDLLNAKRYFKKLARQYGCKHQDLLALHQENDPFYHGTKLKRAKWFASVVNRLYGNETPYLRRLHYRMASQDPPVMIDDGNRPYLNNDACWALLCKASGVARNLGLIDGSMFIDKRSRPARIFFDPEDNGPGVEIADDFDEPDFKLPEFPNMPNYEYYPANQSHRYHVEVWTEKDTMEDILTPICEGMEVNLIVGIGELTKTSVDRLFDRIGEYNKPCRILYISDFDPVGQQMPVSIARKIEFNHRTQSSEKHIMLYPIVLTAEQCEHFKLPRIPIENKKGKQPYQTRIDKFEKHHGEGGTELDALEAIRPGELKNIVTAAIENYRDENVVPRHKKINEAYLRRLNRIETEVLSEFSHRFDPLYQEYSDMIRRFQDEFDVIKQHVDDLKDDIREELENRMPDFSGYEPPVQARPSNRRIRFTIRTATTWIS